MGQLDKDDLPGLRERLKAALATAEAEENCERVGALRLAMCALRDRDATARAEDRCSGCEETEISDMLRTLVHQREESAEEHESDGRFDDARREREEADVLKSFLPKPLSEDALEAAAKIVVEDLDAKGLKDIGKCTSALKARYPGQVTPAAAKAAVREILG